MPQPARGNLVRLMHWLPFSLTHLTSNQFFALLWIVLGLLWLHRAYVGEKAGVLYLLKPNAEVVMTREERKWAVFVGLLLVALGVVEFIYRRG